MKRLLTALRFLTAIPIPGGADCTADDLSRCAVCFPVVGLLAGGLLAAAAYGLGLIFAPLVTAVLAVVLIVSISGGFHMDGLSDTADGFLSSRPRERILEIMKDSRIGAMGVMAIVCIILLKVAALASMEPVSVWRAVALMVVAGRCSLLFAAVLLPCANPESSLGAVFLSGRSPLEAVWAVAVLLATGWFVAGWGGLVAGGTGLLALVLFCLYCYRRIGGATGDTLGAACELVETAVALALVARPLQGLIG